MNIFVIFFICCLVISILIIIIGRKQVDNTNSQTPIAIELKNGKNVVGKFFQALETIEILQNTTEWETFTIRVDFLQELSQSLMVAFITEQDKETASRQYLQAYGKKTLSMRQEDFLTNYDLNSNSGFLAKLKARFFIDFCERMTNEIENIKTDNAKQKRKEHIKEVASSIMQDLENSNHIGLSTLIKQEAEQCGVIL